MTNAAQRFEDPRHGPYTIGAYGREALAAYQTKPVPKNLTGIIVVEAYYGRESEVSRNVGSDGKALKYNGLTISPIFTALAEDLLARHPGAVVAYAPCYGQDFALPADYGVPPEVSVSVCWGQELTMKLGESNYTIRKFSTDADLRHRVASGISSLRAMERKRIERAIANGTGPDADPMLADPVAQWLMQRLRPEAAAETAAILDAWHTHDEANTPYITQAELIDGDVVGSARSPAIVFRKGYGIVGTVTIGGGARISGDSVTIGPISETIARGLVGRDAVAIADHELLAGRTIATVSTHKTHTQIVLAPTRHKPYRPGTIVPVPYAEGELSTKMEELMDEANCDSVTRRYLKLNQTETLYRRMHRIVRMGRSESTYERRDPGDLRLYIADKRLHVTGMLANNVTWSNGSIQISHLAETVVMAAKKTVGRPVRDVVDHPVFEGMRIRAVHVVQPRLCPVTKTMTTGYLALHVEPEGAVPLAA